MSSINAPSEKLNFPLDGVDPTQVQDLLNEILLFRHESVASDKDVPYITRKSEADSEGEIVDFFAITHETSRSRILLVVGSQSQTPKPLIISKSSITSSTRL